ncbi:MAG: 3-hydroxyacyl-CoA dehydrogenase [Burkholderiaceae bacterium]|nr:3-hydroxyacyl-CoA dehydrogenase [Burkholderiaceae bacterium]
MTFKGKSVVAYEPYPEALAKCKVAHETYARIYATELGASDADIESTRSRLSYSGDLGSAVANADLVIEAVPEIPEIKTGDQDPRLSGHGCVAAATYDRRDEFVDAAAPRLCSGDRTAG